MALWFALVLSTATVSWFALERPFLSLKRHFPSETEALAPKTAPMLEIRRTTGR